MSTGVKRTNDTWNNATEKFVESFKTKDPFHVEVHSHRGCGNCYWWDCEDHDCTRPGACDHLSGWRSNEDKP